MPISLTEAAKELAQAATTVDRHIDEAYRTRIMQDFEMQDGAFTPLFDTIKINGREVLVPRMTLRDHRRLEAEEIEIGLESDANLEGREFRAPPRHHIRLTKGTGDGELGFSLRNDDGGPYGGLVGDTPTYFTVRDIDFQLFKVIYMPELQRLAFGFQRPFPDMRALEGARAELIAPGTADAYAVSFVDARQWYEPSGWVNFDVAAGDLDWLAELENGAEFDVTFYDAAAEIELENIIGKKLSDDGTYYDIMVTLQAGIDPTASHVSLRCKFVRQPTAEGAARLNDRLNERLGEAMV